jgi:lipoprotein signal peptidase
MKITRKKDTDKYFLYTYFSLFLFLLDRLSKKIATMSGNNFLLRYNQFFCIPPLKNYHTSLSLMSLSNRYVFIGFLFFTIIIIAGLLYKTYEKYRDRKDIWGECFILAGGLGNLYDRIVYGYVVDFILFKIPILDHCTIYNLADAYIFFGILYILWESFFTYQE